jgi:hypothetical protein
MRALILVALLAIGCGGRQGPPGGDDNAIVVIRCDVEDASFWLDGRYIEEIGRIPRAGVSIKPGLHRLEIRHDDYFSHYSEIELAPRERRTLDVNLAPVLP